MNEAEKKSAQEATEHWLDVAVIGLNLCPFAKAVHAKQQIRYSVTDASTPDELLDVLTSELEFLVAADAQLIDTTLLIHPQALLDFLDYNDFLELADDLLCQLGLDGTLQIASFHPQYEFADSPPGDITHNTNRSPYPMLHLLREASIDKAVAVFPDAEAIYAKNQATLRALGHAGWTELLKQAGLPTR